MSRQTRWELPNGLRVLYQQDDQFPLASATLLFGAGSRREKRDEAGLSSMTVDLLMQGTRRHNAKAIARHMESIGASMGTQAHEDYAEMGFIAPATELERALGMMAEVLREPSFPAEEIKKERAHVLADLECRHDAIFHLAYDHFSRTLYGTHPYGRPLEGRPDSVKRFSRGEFHAWNRSHSTPRDAILSIVAPYPQKKLLNLLRKSMERWDSPRPSPRTVARPLPLVKPVAKSTCENVSSTFQQAYLMTGWQAPSAHDPDQLTLKVLNTLLGGGMSSRLFVKLREELGLAYEVSSFFPTRLDKSQWVIYLGLPRERLVVAAQRLEGLLQEMAAKGPTESEMRQAKAMIRGAFLMDRQSRRRQGWYNAWWEFLGRGSDYGERFLEAVDTVSSTKVRDLMRTFLSRPRVTVRVIPR